eukprot:353632-Chlamydomonas_euryale.AAC.6
MAGNRETSEDLNGPRTLWRSARRSALRQARLVADAHHWLLKEQGGFLLISLSAFFSACSMCCLPAVALAVLLAVSLRRLHSRRCRMKCNVMAVPGCTTWCLLWKFLSLQRLLYMVGCPACVLPDLPDHQENSPRPPAAFSPVSQDISEAPSCCWVCGCCLQRCHCFCRCRVSQQGAAAAVAAAAVLATPRRSALRGCRIPRGSAVGCAASASGGGAGFSVAHASYSGWRCGSIDRSCRRVDALLLKRSSGACWVAAPAARWAAVIAIRVRGGVRRCRRCRRVGCGASKISRWCGERGTAARPGLARRAARWSEVIAGSSASTAASAEGSVGGAAQSKPRDS